MVLGTLNLYAMHQLLIKYDKRGPRLGACFVLRWRDVQTAAC